MTLKELQKFARDLGLVRIEAIVSHGERMHWLTIRGVDYYFYNHAFPRPGKPDWPTENVKEYDGWGSSRPDIIADAAKGDIQGLAHPEITGDETTLGGTDR